MKEVGLTGQWVLALINLGAGSWYQRCTGWDANRQEKDKKARVVSPVPGYPRLSAGWN